MLKRLNSKFNEIIISVITLDIEDMNPHNGLMRDEFLEELGKSHSDKKMCLANDKDALMSEWNNMDMNAKIRFALGSRCYQGFIMLKAMVLGLVVALINISASVFGYWGMGALVTGVLLMTFISYKRKK